ncbi:MAG TPA: 16S rRNA (cytosine(1402)-N(4))-methyltransferase RsmH [Candidatus Saccharimonadales bacterium]|jgi:16S rRNA (cytosine1402-N4)-methyltransferase|nr:16S rRNA (cytosine(1402)-N(4))-methyltransferase RsmH [Candidatus Saccharimonadales bacterium]
MRKTPPQHRESSEPSSQETQKLHLPVLLETTIDYLAPKQGETYLDLTAGYGGHAKAVAEKIGTVSNLTLVDRDAHAARELEALIADGARFLHSDFLSAAQLLEREGQQFDMILADLGVSSPQLDRSERGFSFAKSGPLDMRMDQREPLTVADIVNRYPEAHLANIIYTYGEEPKSRQIAKSIVRARPLRTTGELAEAIASSFRSRGKTHPATRTFQALRIALNRELEQLESLLPILPKLLKPGGRVAIISFHSLEDRLVKQFFSEQASAGYEADMTLLTKRPLAGTTHDASNPRARSAKLRVAAKIKKERG